MSKINPKTTKDIAKYSGFDFSACYNCGNCTATCSLTEADANFPRMMIRYSVLGLHSEIVKSKEPWLCYACGDCSLTCPRQAEPAALMAGLRRYNIAHYEITGLTKLIFKSSPFAIAIIALLSVVLGFFLLTIKPEMEVSRWIFEFLPYDVLHNVGILAFAIMGISALIGIIRMAVQVSGSEFSTKNFIKRAWEAKKMVAAEAVTMKRHKNCDSDASVWNSKPWYVRPWFVHYTIMWGFIGLLLATSLNFMFKDPATNVWWPTRILGIVTGIAMMYGASIALYYRIIKITKAYQKSVLADWMFLILLWFAGATGFWLLGAVIADDQSFINHVVFIVHTIVSMQLVILFAFSKFAHAFYRPLALFFYYLEK